MNVDFMEVSEVRGVEVGGMFVEGVVRMWRGFGRGCVKFEEGWDVVELVEVVGGWWEGGG